MRDPSSGIGFSTLAIHAGDRQAHAAAHRTAFNDLLEAVSSPGLAAFHELSSHMPDPIGIRLEERIDALDGGSAAVAVASGSIARTLALKTLLRPGDELITSRGCGARTDDADYFERCGWQVRWADRDRPESFAEALSDKTRAILVESVGYDGQLTDVESISRAAQEGRVPLIVDNTLATPCLMRPLDHGADVVLYAAVSYLGGQDGLEGGLIVDGGTFDWTGDARYPAISGPSQKRGGVAISEAFGNFAFAVACRLAGLDAFGNALAPSYPAATLYGIETLLLRMQRHCESALTVARSFERHPAIRGVRYAALQGDRSYDIAQRFWPNGVGAICLFDLAGGAGAAGSFMDRLRLFSKATKVGTARSSIAQVVQADSAPSDGLRLSIGLEDVDDLIADLSQALAG